MASNVVGKRQRRQELDGDFRSQGELRQANRHMHELLELLGHDLRRSLAAIHDALFILGQPGDDAAEHEQAQSAMERQTLFIGRLVKDLLEMSYIEHGKVRLDQQLQDLANLDASGRDAAHIRRAGRPLEVAPPEPVVSDAVSDRFEQALTNVLDDAAKFTEPGGRVWVTAEIHGSDVALRIRDGGASADSAVLPQIFDAYWQVEHTFDRAQGGLSIGLALVRKLAEMHGGSTSVHSLGSGHGSEFVVRMPTRADVSRAAAAENRASSPKRTRAKATGS